MMSCAHRKNTSSSVSGYGDTRTKKVELLDDRTYLLTETTDDKTYGYDPSNPVKVGGAKDNEGPLNERRFLNALQGPNGEEVTFFRAGSCCHFKTPNGLFGDGGLLDKYRVTWAGSADTLNIYINLYDYGDLKIPVGMTARAK